MDKFKKILYINFLILGVVIISGCGDAGEVVIVDDSKEDNVVVENNKSCNVDSDCVPASCCHATDVVNKGNAPSCENLKCTLSCETILDCGQGRPVCNGGQCEIEKNIDGNLGIEEIEDVNETSSINFEKNDPFSEENLEKEKQKCLKEENAHWSDITWPPFCNHKTSDADKSCEKESDCEGRCLCESIFCEWKLASGKCSANEVKLGCYSFLDDDGKLSGICQD